MTTNDALVATTKKISMYYLENPREITNHPTCARYAFANVAVLVDRMGSGAEIIGGLLTQEVEKRALEQDATSLLLRCNQPTGLSPL